MALALALGLTLSATPGLAADVVDGSSSSESVASSDTQSEETGSQASGQEDETSPDSPQTPSDASQDDSSADSSQGCWVKGDDGLWRYVEDGEALIGWHELSDPENQSGDACSWRWLDPERGGAMATSCEAYAPREDGSGQYAWYWLDADGSRAELKFAFVPADGGGKWCWYGEDGAMCYGALSLEAGDYWLDECTGAVTYGFVLQSDPATGGQKWCWYGPEASDGIMRHGEQCINGSWYYLNEETGAVTYGFVLLPDGESGQKWCWYGPEGGDGIMRYGEQCIDGAWYYLTPVTGAVDYGFALIPDGVGGYKWCYYGSEMGDGKMRHGEAYIDGGWYYLDDCTGAVQYGWRYLAGEGKTVYYESPSGRMAHGQLVVDGRLCLFDQCTGALLSSPTDAAREAAVISQVSGDVSIPASYRSSLSLGYLVSSGEVGSVRVFGDSIMAGLGASSYLGDSDNYLFSYGDEDFYEPSDETDCAGNSLRSWLADKGVSMVNASVPWWGSMNFYSKLGESAMGDEDLAIVVLGANDRGSFDATELLGDFLTYAERFISLVEEHYGGNVIVLSAMPVLSEDYNFTLSQENEALGSLCSSHGWAFGSLYRAFSYVANGEGLLDTSQLYTDGTHPNDTGQAVLWEALRQVLVL